jgi:4-carboxymuconolactone decarboxylase
MPKSASKEERAVYDFIRELYRTKRVSNRNYARVHALVGDAGMVEFVGILGYYVLVAMTLNVFRMPVPAGAPMPFGEPMVR